MPVHDRTLVGDGTFHDFHYSWVLEIKRALKRGLLPKGYYVMAEQIGGDLGAPDVLTLQMAGQKPDSDRSLSGTATLTGQITGNTITANFSGQLQGLENCNVTGSGTATRI